jgi:protein TonB
MKQKPQLTDEEIRSHMDFDKLLQLSKTAGAGLAHPTPQWLTYITYILPAVTVLLTVLYYVWPDKNENYQPVPDHGQNSSLNLDGADLKETPPIQSPAIKREEKKPATLPPAKWEDNKQSTQPKEEKISLSKFTQAEPLDGYSALYEYFNRELKYPVEVAKDSIEGTVTVSFAINEQGKLKDIRIVNSLGEAFDKESIRIIENMPAWKAATVNGKATETRMSIPLTFRIKR